MELPAVPALLTVRRNYEMKRNIMKAIQSLCLFSLIATAPAAGVSDEPFRKDINPALRYFQAFMIAPDLSQADRDYLFNREWRGLNLPERFGEAVARYDKEFVQVRQAAQSAVPCDWGIDMSPGPFTLLPHLARCKAVAQAARLRALWNLQHARQAEARDDLLAALALGRNSARDGVLISVLVQIAMESIVCSAVAENFYQFSPETLKQLVDGFDAAPPRTTVAAVMAGEESFFAKWMEKKVLRLQKENPGDEAKVMAGIQAVVENTLGGGGEQPSEAQPNVWEQVTQKAHTSEEILKLLREEGPLYQRLAAVMALPQAEFERQIKQFVAEVHESSNPFVALTFPALEKCRPKEFMALAQLAMLRAAVEYKLHGEPGLKGVSDPFGQGPFAFRRFVFEGVDRGFELKSAFNSRGFEERLIFVEKDGPPFQINGKNAGQAVPNAPVTK